MPRIHSNEKLVYSILKNLLSNAVKFTQDGEVRVSTGCSGSDFHVKVKDTGIGISQKDLPHVFEKFRQVDGSISRHYEGIGLGLALAKKGAKILGGDISVESEPGKGSVFALTLPVGNGNGNGKIIDGEHKIR